MPVIGLTGGIAAGKSTVSRLLTSALGADFFDSDLSARELSSRADIKSRIREEFGFGVFDAEGELDRGKMRAIVFADVAERRKLEAILHPLVRSQWLSQAKVARDSSRWLLVDIPLLFETGAEENLDATVVIACDRATQVERLARTRGIDEVVATGIIAAQMDLLAKVKNATYVIWNDSTMKNVERQVILLSNFLLSRYGRHDR